MGKKKRPIDYVEEAKEKAIKKPKKGYAVTYLGRKESLELAKKVVKESKNSNRNDSIAKNMVYRANLANRTPHAIAVDASKRAENKSTTGWKDGDETQGDYIGIDSSVEMLKTSPMQRHLRKEFKIDTQKAYRAMGKRVMHQGSYTKGYQKYYNEQKVKHNDKLGFRILPKVKSSSKKASSSRKGTSGGAFPNLIASEAKKITDPALKRKLDRGSAMSSEELRYVHYKVFGKSTGARGSNSDIRAKIEGKVRK